MKNNKLYLFEDKVCGGIIDYNKKKQKLTITVVSRPKELKFTERLKIGLIFLFGFLVGKKNVENSVIIDDEKQLKKVREYLKRNF